jgi:hypothetical protein
MECKLEFRAKAAMLAALLLTACGAETPLDGEAFESICYRGQVVMAERRGDALYVDFDLEATSSERWCNEEERSALRSLPQGAPALDTQGRRAPAPGTGSVWVGSDTYGAYWVGGVVPYEIDSSFSSTQRNRILNAMQHWEDRVPGIHFTPKDSSPCFVDQICLAFQRLYERLRAHLGREDDPADERLHDGFQHSSRDRSRARFAA